MRIYIFVPSFVNWKNYYVKQNAALKILTSEKFYKEKNYII
jgi:hypothetical protein